MEIKLENFHGPFDLLLKLIRRSEIDIHDIPMARVTEEYLEAIASFPPDMEEMSEFLVMAATLLEIKSKMLLPGIKNEDEIEEDPREALARRLLAYEQAQALAKQIERLTPIGLSLPGMGEKELLSALSDGAASQPVMDTVSLSYLAKIFSDVMNRSIERIDHVRAGYGEMPRERFTVSDKVEHIVNALREKGKLWLSALFFGCRSKSEMVVTFLALLEMVRRGMIFASQPKAFGDVEVMPCPA